MLISRGRLLTFALFCQNLEKGDPSGMDSVLRISLAYIGLGGDMEFPKLNFADETACFLALFDLICKDLRKDHPPIKHLDQWISG